MSFSLQKQTVYNCLVNIEFKKYKNKIVKNLGYHKARNIELIIDAVIAAKHLRRKNFQLV